MNPVLSATLIVRNEERVLGACLSSLAPLVDEIVVVDTGSSDASVEIAVAHGAKIFHFTWNDDFSAARNYAIEKASCPWLLYIDADERLRNMERTALRATLAASDAIAATVRFHPRTGFTAYREYRLFRRDPRLRFKGVVHESMLGSIKHLVDTAGMRIAESELTIDHVGYDGPQTHKAERYLRQLKEATARDPGRVYLWWHLGSIHRDMGRAEEAEACWRHGVALVDARSERNTDDCLCHVELIKLELARGGDAAELIAATRRLRPEHHLLQWLEGKSLLRRGRFKDAAEIFTVLAHIDPETVVAESAYDKHLFGANAADLVAECAFRDGNYAEAARWYGIAERVTNGSLEYRSKRRLAEIRMRRAAPGAP